jgi:hypothetical protein
MLFPTALAEDLSILVAGARARQSLGANNSIDFAARCIF